MKKRYVNIDNIYQYKDIINIKFKDYERCMLRPPTSKFYRQEQLFEWFCDEYEEQRRYYGLRLDQLEQLLLENYKYHIYGHKNYHKITEQRAANKIIKFMKN